MSECGSVRKLTLSGLLVGLLTLGPGFGVDAALAGGSFHSASPLVLSRMVLAQAAESDVAVGVADVDGKIDETVPFSELNEALNAARSRLNELTKAAEIAKVAGELRGKLEATEAENQQLKAVLTQLQQENSDLLAASQTTDSEFTELKTASESAKAEVTRLNEDLLQLREELSARDQGLAALSEQSTAEITRLESEIAAAQALIVTTEQSKAEAAGELAILKETTAHQTSDRERLERDLNATITQLAKMQAELDETQTSLKQAEDERDGQRQAAEVLRQELVGNRAEAEQLKVRLEITEAELSHNRELNASLEQQVDLLKTAAGEATDAARQNLLAVENQINEINEALAAVKGEELLLESGEIVIEEDAVEPVEIQPAAATDDAAPLEGSWVPRPSPRRNDQEPQLVAVATADSAVQPLVGQGAIVRDPLASDAATINLASLTSELPANRRSNAESLLAELGAEVGELGLSMAVPGAQLFEMDSEEIEPGALETLADVAQLVNLYGDQDVLIVGHTDAVGDAVYNQQLSERRAALVKAFFVDEFEIDEARLQIEGRGEEDPISSNATADGRNANRRVEVIILD